MTRSLILKGDDPPVNIPRDELLAIEHVLLHCCDLMRSKCFDYLWCPDETFKVDWSYKKHIYLSLWCSPWQSLMKQEMLKDRYIYILNLCFFHWRFVSTHCTVKYCVTLQGSYRFFTSKFKNVSQTFQRPKRYFQRPVLLISSSKINLKYDNKCYQIIIQFLKIPSLLVQSTILH